MRIVRWCSEESPGALLLLATANADMNIFLILSNIIYARMHRKQEDLEALEKRARGERSADIFERAEGGEGNSARRDAERRANGSTGADEEEDRSDRMTLWSRTRKHFHNAKSFILQEEIEEEGDAEHKEVYRWLPIFSGIVVPFSILLEIPGLTEHWYIVTENNKVIDSKKNSALLDTGMSISMACAVIANIAMIFRFLESKVRTSTLIAIMMLTIHDIINIVAVTIFGVMHRFDDGFTFGQSYWFTVCSTVASTATNISIIVDYVWTPDFAWSSSGLTRKQRALVIVVMVLLCWIAFGGLINSILMGLDFIDGMYFTVVTIETVGFGDIVPKTTGSRVFAGFHGVVGLLNIALAVNICNTTVIESFDHTYKKRLRKLFERRKERRAYRKELKAKELALKHQLEQSGLPVYVDSHGDEYHHNPFSHGVHLNVEALTAQQKANATREALEASTRMSRRKDGSERKSIFSLDLSFDSVFVQELKRDHFFKLVIVWSTFLGFWLVGAAVFMATEGWSYGMAIWFCFETFTTIGYGDQTPQSPAGRSIFIVWALHGIGTMTILISVLSEIYDSRYQRILRRKVKKPVRKVAQAIAGKGPKPETLALNKPATTGESFFAPKPRSSTSRHHGKGWTSLPNLPRHVVEESHSSESSSSDSESSDSSYSVDPRVLWRQRREASKA